MINGLGRRLDTATIERRRRRREGSGGSWGPPIGVLVGGGTLSKSVYDDVSRAATLRAPR